jgi:hypothetical protein
VPSDSLDGFIRVIRSHSRSNADDTIQENSGHIRTRNRHR